MPSYQGNVAHERLKENIESIMDQYEPPMTWSSMGRRADISTSMVTNIRHLRSTPSLATLSKIAEALDVPISDLVEGC